MNYTVLSARFANPENTVAILQTAEAGAVVTSQRDTPHLWALLDGVAVAAYAAPPWEPIKAAEVVDYIETREKMCARVAGIGQRLARAGDTAGAVSCDAVVNALLDVLAHPSVTGATDLVALKLALKSRYVAAVSLASASARAEFKRYDQ